MTSKVFPMMNITFLAIGGCGIAVVYIMNKRYGEEIEVFLKMHYRSILFVLLVFLLFWQLYTCYGGYFISGWDAGIIRNTVLLEYNCNYGEINNEYFSWFPNNMLIVWIFTNIARIADKVGFSNWEYALVVFQCMIDVVTIWLVYKVAFGFSGSHRISFLAFFTAYLFVGISPWFIVAYSDATGFLIPILIIRLNQLSIAAEEGVKKTVWTVLMGIVSVAGYYLKPQTFIAFLAVILVEVLCLKSNFDKTRVRIFFEKTVCCAAGILIFLCFYQGLIIPSLHLQRNHETTIGWQHYFMMGLNSESDGVYSSEDYQYTRSFSTNEERNKADLEEARNRITALGPIGLIKHMSRKQLVNYGDGTFAWNVEGHSFSGDPEWAQNRISNVVRSFIKPDGLYYNWFISFKQLLWVVIIFFQLFACLFKSDRIGLEEEKTIWVMVVSIIGLSMFELLFEARARYLFCYAPVYVILFAFGVRNMYYALKAIRMF